jgi:hypothetical protein
MGRPSTKDELTAFGKKIQTQIDKLKGKPYVEMGFPEEQFGTQQKPPPGQTPTGTLTVGQIAVINEFGTDDDHVPERSFLRSTFDVMKPKWLRLTDKYRNAIMEGKMTVMKALELIGLVQVSDVRLKVKARIPPPNAPSTIKQKTVNGKIGDVPLIDSGQMINETLTHKVIPERKAEE